MGGVTRLPQGWASELRAAGQEQKQMDLGRGPSLQGAHTEKFRAMLTFLAGRGQAHLPKNPGGSPS